MSQQTAQDDKIPFKSAIQRSDLEQSKTVDEMKVLVDLFHDFDAFPHKVIRQQREPILKDLQDEYLPLFGLMSLFPVSKGRLSPRYEKGPDAIIDHPDGTFTTVQIRTCHRSADKALQNRMFAEGAKYSFTAAKRVLVGGKLDGHVEESGRILRHADASIEEVVKQVETAFADKVTKYFKGTKSDTLLIYGQMGTVKPVWKQLVLAILDAAPAVPYKRVFVADQNDVHIDYCRSTVQS